MQPKDVEDFEIHNIWWTTDGTADTLTSPTELPCVPSDASLGPEYNNTKHSIVLLDAQILQDAKDWPSSLIEREYNSIISKSPVDVGRTNLFSNGYSKSETTNCMQAIPNSIKVSKVHQWGNKVVKNAGDIFKSVILQAARVIIVPKTQTS